MEKYMSRKNTLHFKGEMVRAGYTIGSLATELGISRSTLSSRINGITDFLKSEMERIGELFCKPPADIFFTVT